VLERGVPSPAQEVLRDDALGLDLWIEHAGTIINVADAAAARPAAAAIRSKYHD
jgi:hypothetical protein